MNATDISQLSGLKIAVVGHVDHGKSTVLARLMFERGQVPADRLDKVKRICEAQGKRFEWAFLLDALEEEQSQGITIDVSHFFWFAPERQITFIDAPGHREFLKNMVSGASEADAALLVIDAKEGVCEQSRRHGFLLNFLGIGRVVVAVNKMDLPGYSRPRFDKIAIEYRAFLKSLGIEPIAIVPVSGTEGDNIAQPSKNMPWYTGEPLADLLEHMKLPERGETPLRFVVQGVYKFDERRIAGGRVEAGRVKVGDKLLFLPSDKLATVKTIERWSYHGGKAGGGNGSGPNGGAGVSPAPGSARSLTGRTDSSPSHGDAQAATANATASPDEAGAGESVGLTFTEQIFIERRDIGAHLDTLPKLSDRLHAKVFWLGDKPMAPGSRYVLKLGTQRVPAAVERILRALNTETLERTTAERIERTQVGEVVFTLGAPLAFDDFGSAPRTGRFVVVDNENVVGGGIIDDAEYPDLRKLMSKRPVSENISFELPAVTAEERARAQGHGGAVLWLTGLSGSGKSTLARALDRVLFEAGVRSFVLDGDNLRHGLNSDLGFSPNERAENVRRVAEVAKLMSDAGLVVITALISPYRAGREHARAAVGERFVEVFIDCPLDICQKRDVKGLYKKQKQGEIKGFTGVSAPYELPAAPDLHIETARINEQASLELLLEKLREMGVRV